MEDSLEDYIKLSRNTKEEPVDASKEIRISAQRKKESDMRAMKIVEFSIEGKLRPEIFIRCLPFINEAFYQDIVEERAISKLCGYSICGKKIPEMPKKQYYISVKSNKVYDITDRKNYCSNFCYKASLHIKKQLDSSPLWLRNLKDIQKYQLLESTERGLPGEFIDQGIMKPAVEPTFTSVSLFTETSLEDMVEHEKGRNKIPHEKKVFKKSSKFKNPPKSTMKTIVETPELVLNEITPVENTVENLVAKETFAKTQEAVESKVNNESVAETDTNPNKDKNVKENSTIVTEVNMKKTKKGAKRKQVDVESVIRRVFRDWLTLETYIFIHGESKVKEVLDEKKLSDCFEQLNISNLQREQQMKYLNICKRLQLQEIADEKFDNALIGNSKLKPPPDYRQLKEENKDLTLKVKCFYGGTLHEKEDTNFPKKTNKNNETTTFEDGPPAVLPLMDQSSQNALRRKVFLTSVNKSMQLLLQDLRVTHYLSVLSDLQTLVKTFNLKADNVVFKPFIWNYIAMVLLHILSIRDKRIENILQETPSQAYIELQLSSLPNRNEFINDITATVRNIDSFLEYFISSK